MDKVALMSDCAKAQADLELHCPHLAYLPGNVGVKVLGRPVTHTCLFVAAVSKDTRYDYANLITMTKG